MAFCPHHPKLGLKFDGEKLVCSHPDCDYRKDTPYKKIPDQKELLDIIHKLIEILDDVAENGDILYSNNELELIQSARKLV